MTKICDNTINQDDFSFDEHPNFFANKEYFSLRPLLSRLIGIPATSAFVERVFFSHCIFVFLLYFDRRLLLVGSFDL